LARVTIEPGPSRIRLVSPAAIDSPLASIGRYFRRCDPSRGSGYITSELWHVIIER
jgi:hypothetical protein